MSEAPRVRFLLGGVQKAGTTALARYLERHPHVALPRSKEAHVFDDPHYDESWGAAEVDARFAPFFDASSGGRLKGDATPITVFHPRLIARVAAYNPAMRWIILLRDPVDRAISQYYMERSRGCEPRGLLAAVLLERSRLRDHENDWRPQSPLRVHSYAARGRYAAQLDALYARFPRSQVLLLRASDLAVAPEACLARVAGFLGLSPMPHGLEYPRVFEGRYRAPPAWSPGRLALRWILRGETARLRRHHGFALD